MIKTRTETKDVEVDESVVCNRCKAEARYEDYEGGGVYRAPDYVHVAASYGYGSPHFGDGTLIQFDLCEACVKWLTSQFAIPPKTNRDE